MNWRVEWNDGERAYEILDPHGRVWESFRWRGAFKRACTRLNMLIDAYLCGRSSVNEVIGA